MKFLRNRNASILILLSSASKGAESFNKNSESLDCINSENPIALSKHHSFPIKGLKNKKSENIEKLAVQKQESTSKSKNFRRVMHKLINSKSHPSLIRDFSQIQAISLIFHKLIKNQNIGPSGENQFIAKNLGIDRKQFYRSLIDELSTQCYPKFKDFEHSQIFELLFEFTNSLFNYRDFLAVLKSQILNFLKDSNRSDWSKHEQVRSFIGNIVCTLSFFVEEKLAVISSGSIENMQGINRDMKLNGKANLNREEGESKSANCPMTEHFNILLASLNNPVMLIEDLKKYSSEECLNFIKTISGDERYASYARDQLIQAAPMLLGIPLFFDKTCSSFYKNLLNAPRSDNKDLYFYDYTLKDASKSSLIYWFIDKLLHSGVLERLNIFLDLDDRPNETLKSIISFEAIAKVSITIFAAYHIEEPERLFEDPELVQHWINCFSYKLAIYESDFLSDLQNLNVFILEKDCSLLDSAQLDPLYMAKNAKSEYKRQLLAVIFSNLYKLSYYSLREALRNSYSTN